MGKKARRRARVRRTKTARDSAAQRTEWVCRCGELVPAWSPICLCGATQPSESSFTDENKWAQSDRFAAQAAMLGPLKGNKKTL